MKKGVSWKTIMFIMLCSNCRVKMRWGRAQAWTSTTSWAKATTPTAPMTIVPLHPAVASTSATIWGTPQPRQRSTVATATATIPKTSISMYKIWDCFLVMIETGHFKLIKIYIFPSKYVSECSSAAISRHGYCGQSHHHHSLGRAMLIYWHCSRPLCWSGNRDKHYRR